MKFLLPVFLFIGSACNPARPLSSVIPQQDYLFVSEKIASVQTDALFNIYIVDGEDRLIRFDSTGNDIHQITNKNLGHIHSLDTGNPFKLFVFYRDQQTAVLLDNTLSEIQRISFSEWQLQDVTAACLSADNNIWLFDGVSRTLRKCNDRGESLLTSDPIQLTSSTTKRPDYIYDVDHSLFLQEHDKPMDVFNDFGAYVQTIDIVVPKPKGISNDFLVYSNAQAFMAYDLKNLRQLTLGPTTGCTSCFAIPFGKAVLYVDERGIQSMK